MQLKYSEGRKLLFFLCGFYATHALNTRKLIGSVAPCLDLWQESDT